MECLSQHLADPWNNTVWWVDAWQLPGTRGHACVSAPARPGRTPFSFLGEDQQQQPLLACSI
jgi:hypothetical protein